MRTVYKITLLFVLAVLSTACQQKVVPLNIVAEMEQGPGNITVTPDKRIIVSLHQFFQPQWRVAEWKANQLIPFPNETIASSQDAQVKLHSVLGIQSDSKGRVWMLDNGMRARETPKLVAWDTKSDTLFKIIYLPSPVTPNNAFVNDLAIDETNHKIYIADPAGGSNAALIVVDMKTGAARRVLQGHQSVIPEEIDLQIDGNYVAIKREDGSSFRPRVGVNPIALDANNEWLYYGPMHGTRLYRIPVAYLNDNKLDPNVLAQHVEVFAKKPICDGISIDTAGNIYISDIGNNAIGVITPNRQYQHYIENDYLSWPDAFSFGPDGNLYTAVNQLHKTAVLNNGEHSAKPPYYIFSFEPLATGVVGR